MRIATAGLWHLGTVMSAALASAGHEVIALDFDAQTVAGLRDGKPPLFEPGLEELVQQGLANGSLRFTTDPAEALRDAELVWITYDTPVDDEDHADVAFVLERVERLFDHLADGTLVVSSSQLPVGSVRELERRYATRSRNERVSFACSPENLRLGAAIDAFLKPARVVAGVRSDADRAKLAAALAPITSTVEWMSVESAEMTKHALNAFLATSVAFINEIAAVCEATGADAKEVERGLKSDPRIGPRAYLSAGGAFAGGTLARDIAFLSALQPLELIPAVRTSNELHKTWTRRTLQAALGDLKGRAVAIWGLTYKPGTDTLRRSAAVELCRWLFEQGAVVHAHDPAVKALPHELASILHFDPSAADAARDVEAVVIATEWPEYRDAASGLSRPGLVVVDANRFVRGAIGANVRYFAVGKGAE